MNTYDNISIVPPDFQFIGGVNDGLTYPLTLNQSSRNYVQGEQNRVLSLQDQYNTERNTNLKFRLSSKFQFVMNNTISGTTNFNDFKNNLYYVNPESSVEGTQPWGGYPQYYEFDFFRNDTTNSHIDFKPVSAYSYNWSFAVTYPHKNVNTKMSYIAGDGFVLNFSASTGIPYMVKKIKLQGKPLILFECPVPHNLTNQNYVLLPVTFNGKNVYPVYSLGDGNFESEIYKFAIYDIGYGTTFNEGDLGTFKKVIDPQNIEETTSIYYCREHKVLITNDDINVVKSGFELNGFNPDKKLEYSALTPNNVRRISIKNATQSYSVISNKDVVITGLTDNNGLPVTKLFNTIINKGYAGYFNKPKIPNQNRGGLKTGWDFNITSGGTNTWWTDTNLDAVLPLRVGSYQQSNGSVGGKAGKQGVGGSAGNGANFTFYYNLPLSVNDTLIGDFCEFNKLTQTEFVISENYHKINFNQTVFPTSSTPENSEGYYYKPHFEIPIRSFSTYVENFNGQTGIDNLPYWAYYSKNYNKWIWRDLYDPGFIDQDGNGVDYPFSNNANYVFRNFIFKLIPEGRTNKSFTQVIYQPLSDDCQ